MSPPQRLPALSRPIERQLDFGRLGRFVDTGSAGHLLVNRDPGPVQRRTPEIHSIDQIPAHQRFQASLEAAMRHSVPAVRLSSPGQRPGPGPGPGPELR